MKCNSYHFYPGREEAQFQIEGICYFYKREKNGKVAVYKDGHDGPDSHRKVGGEKAKKILAAVEEFAKEHKLALTRAGAEAGNSTGKHIPWTA